MTDHKKLAAQLFRLSQEVRCINFLCKTWGYPLSLVHYAMVHRLLKAHRN